jgi:cytochrome c oxidase subunit 3
MSTITHGPTPEHDEHAAHLAHHFDTEEQQFDSAVLGMWLFLATEILLFAGLFCAYAVYRANHPEIFYHAYHEHYLSVFWGSVNTAILLCSSFTIAAAVWTIQHNRRVLTACLLAFTILCGFGFMGIKYIEYKHKFHAGLLWGVHYDPQEHGHGDDGHAASAAHATAGDTAHGEPEASSARDMEDDAVSPAKTEAAEAAAAGDTPVLDPEWFFKPVTPPETGLLPPGAAPDELSPEDKVRNMQTFFGIYYAMTGLHGLHVIAGMIAIGWVLMRTLKGHFDATYFTPIPLVGLYWHVVDLVWIYLFPLLYLIH